MMTSTVAFPSAPTPAPASDNPQHLAIGSSPDSQSQTPTNKLTHSPNIAREKPIDMFIVSRHATALEVCDFVYGNSPSPSFLDAAELFYEEHAMYENPFITATSRSVISDIYTLTRQLCTVDVPKPLAMLYTLLRFRPPDGGSSNKWFQALQVWSEVGEISESESFDGHKKSIVEHTLNILFFPGLHTGSFGPRPLHPPSSASDSPFSFASPNPACPTDTHLTHPPQALHLSLYGQPPSDPSLPVPYTPLAIPSPLHFQLHILTRLSFNEQGRITHHRDIWDVKDVIGLVPGMGLAQWIAGRIAARGVAWVSRAIMGRCVDSGDDEQIARKDRLASVEKAKDEEHVANEKQLVVAPFEKSPAVAYIDRLRKHGSERKADEEV